MRIDLLKTLLVILLALAIGLIFDRPLLCVLLATLGLLAWQSYQLHMLSRWLNEPQVNSMIDSSGSIYTIYRSISKQKAKSAKRKQQMRQLLKQLRSAVSALPDAIVLLDQHAKIEWANNKASQVLGVRWPEDANVRFADLVRYPEVQSLLSEAHKTHLSVEVNSILNRGTVLNVQCVPYAQAKQLLIARDVSNLVKVSQIHTDFVANVSHELKTPLTVLRGYLEILSDSEAMPTQYLKPLEQMNLQSARMQLIVNDLLYLAKLEDNHNRTEHKPVDVSQLIDNITESVQSLVHDKQQQLRLEIDPNLSIEGDQAELYSAFLNLVTNAISYTPERGLVTLSWQLKDATPVFSVTDSGLGIAPQHLDRLTQRFYRVDDDRSRERGGTGLGLAIVKHVLQRHNAKLKIESELDVGSVFSCIFDRQTRN